MVPGAHSPTALPLTDFSVSAYVHSHKVAPGMIALYTPFGHEVTFVPDQIWDCLKQNYLTEVPDQILNDLISRQFVVPPDFDRNALYKYVIPPMRGFINLWLIVVQTCNMGCSYCVVEADDQTKKLPVLPMLSQVEKGRMTPEIAEAAIQLYARNLEKTRPSQARVTIYGGEPLLNKEVLFSAIPQIREISYTGQKYPIEILCFTNGLTYDESVTALFTKYKVTVGLSLDGKREHHDAARKKLDGSGTFERVVESYNLYKKAGLNIGVSCTIGRHNVDDLPEIARYFIEELKVPSVQFQTPIQVPDTKNEYYIEMKDAAASALAAFKRFRSAGIDEGLAMRRISRFIEGKFHHRDCLAVGGELAVSPDGTTGPCHNATIGGSQYFKGNVLDSKCDPEKQPNFTEWHARMPLNMPDCHGCSFIGLCGGGCPYNALLTKGSIWEKDPLQCGYMEEFVNWLLEDIWERYSNPTAFTNSSPATDRERNSMALGH